MINVAVCSQDFGKSWEARHQILTVGPNRTVAPWSGIGDFDVVWDWQASRWFMLTSHMRGAVSYSKTAAAASWKKWDGEDFTIRESFTSFAKAKVSPLCIWGIPSPFLNIPEAK